MNDDLIFVTIFITHLPRSYYSSHNFNLDICSKTDYTNTLYLIHYTTTVTTLLLQ